jgi:TonB family protein
MAGALISRPDPIYPDEARAQHIEGSVILRARIAKTGAVENVQVISGPPELLVSAIDAVRQWKYKPYLLNGEPTAVDTTITLNFTLAASAAQNGPEAQPLVYLMPGITKKIGDGVSAPQLIFMGDPEYSPQARAAKFNGIVTVALLVDEQGYPADVHVLRGVGMGLDEKAVKQYKFLPAMENGKPVVVALNIAVNFRLPGQAQGAQPSVVYVIEAVQQGMYPLPVFPDKLILLRRITSERDQWRVSKRTL